WRFGGLWAESSETREGMRTVVGRGSDSMKRGLLPAALVAVGLITFSFGDWVGDHRVLAVGVAIVGAAILTAVAGWATTWRGCSPISRRTLDEAEHDLSARWAGTCAAPGRGMCGVSSRTPGEGGSGAEQGASLGYVESRNLVIEFRDAKGKPERFPD